MREVRATVSDAIRSAIIQAVCLVLITLTLPACGDPCEGADMWVKGLCIHTNGYPVTAEEVEASVDMVAFQFGARLTDEQERDTFHLPSLLDEYRVSMTFVDHIPSNDDRIGEYENYWNSIKVQYYPDDHAWIDWYDCYHRRWIMGHEMLHFLDDLYFGGHMHDTPILWKEWAEQNNYPPEDTVEGLIDHHSVRTCLEDVRTVRESQL